MLPFPIKKLKVYEICRNNVKENGKSRPNCDYRNDDIWDKSEAALLTAIKKSKLQYTVNKGEGAFYGPKIEFVLRDAIGRDWQCGTLQVDLNLPGRLGASYVSTDGTKKVPVMLHRALFGSLERFIGILIENYAGKLPFWLSPAQVVVCSIAEENNNYVKCDELFLDIENSISIMRSNSQNRVEAVIENNSWYNVRKAKISILKKWTCS